MFKTKITKEEINELPLAKFGGEMHVITQRDEGLRAVDLLSKEKVLGFDTETRPAYKKGVSYDVSLLQLSTHDSAFLFRLNHCKFINEIKDLLADNETVKTGVAIRDDIKGLKKLNPFEPGQFVEIADLAKDLGIKQLGLRSLAAMILDVRISKQFKLTNWEQPRLKEEQLRYAATDAWIGLKLYEALTELIRKNESN